MIVLDTNVISELFRPRPAPVVMAWLEALTDDVAITTITFAELLAGVRRLPDSRRRTDLDLAITTAIQPYRQSRSLLAFDDTAAEQYADLVVARERVGRPISTADAQIAAICRATGAICATRNTRDFEDTGVALVDPWNG